jgi:hypothetical protein
MAIDSGTLSVIATGIVGVFGGGTLVALFKVGADRSQILVKAAEGAVVVQSGVLDELREEIHRVKQDFREQVDHLQHDNDRLKQENLELRARVAHLEALQG